MNATYRPCAVTQGLSIQQVGEETLIYDEHRHLAFCLNRISYAVWQHCDGSQSVAQIAAALETELAMPVNEEIVVFALAQFEKDGLLESSPDLPAEVNPAILDDISRRKLIMKLGRAAAILLPVAAMIAAPAAAQSGSLGSGELIVPKKPPTTTKKDGNS